MKTYMAKAGFHRNAPVIVAISPPYVERGKASVTAGPLRRHVNVAPRHSWGYTGAGPTQLACDILWDLYDMPPSRELVRQFKVNVIAHLPFDEGWRLSEVQIRIWVSDHGGFTAEVPR